MSTEDVVDLSAAKANQLPCLACDKVIDDASESSVQCSKCDMWCHVKCSMTKEIFEILSKINKSKKKLVKYGMVTFICQTCNPLIKHVEKVSTTSTFSQTSSNLYIPEQAREVASRQPIEVEMTHASPPTPQVSASTQTALSANAISPPDTSNGPRMEVNPTNLPSTSAENVAGPNGARRAPFVAANDTVRSVPSVAANADDARPVNNHVKVVVCKYYRRGTCRHGQSGKTLWNGGACNFRHPRKCIRFCKFGDHPVQGCTKRACPLLHPVICSSSYNNGMCSNINCSFQHLFGTGRTIESTQTNYQTPHTTKYGQIDVENKNRYINSNVNTNSGYSRNYRHGIPKQQQAFNFTPDDFPSLPAFQRQNTTTNSHEIMLMLKNIQQELSIIKQGHSVPTNQALQHEDINFHPNQELAKNFQSQTNRFGQ